MHRITGIRAIAFFLAWSVIGLYQARATIITLADENSVSQFDPMTQAGQFNWFVDGVNQIYEQAFWYRIGNVAEQSLNMLAAPIVTQPTASNFSVQYNANQVQVTTTFSLLGGAPLSGTSDLTEQIRIQNISTGPMEFHFFEYVDFDLAGQTSGDTVQFVNPNAVQQQRGATALSETVNTTLGAASTHREVNFYANTLNALNDGAPTTLNDNVGPIGLADVTWAFEWDFNIAPGSSVFISKDKNLAVPEPMTLVLLAVSGLIIGRRRRAA